jgi:hypothetical protein
MSDQEGSVLGVAIVTGLLSATALWYGALRFRVAVIWARAGILHVPALVLGSGQLWLGGLLGLLSGTLVRRPPAMPDVPLIVSWTIVVFAGVLAIVIFRRPDVEAKLPASLRVALGGRYIVLGAVAAAAVLFVTGYL